MDGPWPVACEHPIQASDNSLKRQYAREARAYWRERRVAKKFENFFCKLKEFKRIAMRCDKADSSFAAAITLASAVINSR